MNKYIFLLFVSILISGCSDGGAGASGNDSAQEPVDDSTFASTDFNVTQLVALPINGESQLRIQLDNLTSDNEIYLVVSSSDVENNKLKITPSRAILNPTQGSASVLLDVKDLDLSSQPDVTVEITSSANSKIEKTIKMQWADAS